MHFPAPFEQKYEFIIFSIGAVGPRYPERMFECMSCMWRSTYIAVSLPELLQAYNES